MKYDLIVVGGGPGGLMSAKTAAEKGLKVLLIERKKELAEVNRACLQIFYLKWVCPDGYLEPVSIELGPDKSWLHLHGPGCRVDYSGPLKPYTNAVWVSPSGHMVFHFKNEPFGFFYDKEHLLAGLLASAQKAGVEVMTGTTALGAENTPDGVKISVKADSGEKTLEARKAIAADGCNSVIVDSLGLNEKRVVIIPNAQGVGFVVEGVEPDVPGHETAHFSFNIPSAPSARTGVGLFSGDTWWINQGSQDLANIPGFESWFSKARVVRKTAFANVVRTPIREPVAGNVVIVGDAAGTAETWIQGAIACGYQAVKAILKELDGQSGYPEFCAWWQKAFYFNDPNYFKRLAFHGMVNKVLNDEETDYVYKLFENERVIPQLAIARNPELLKDNRPELYERIKTVLGKMESKIEPWVAAFPPGSSLFKEPDACLGPWLSYSEVQ
jgi:flavin-dependent dehydrogenase